MFFSWLYVGRPAGRPANIQSTEKHNTYQLLYIYSIPPDDGLQICPKHVEVDWRNKLRINSASSWLHYMEVRVQIRQCGSNVLREEQGRGGESCRVSIWWLPYELCFCYVKLMDVTAPNNHPIQSCLPYFGHIKQITQMVVSVYQLQLLPWQRRFTGWLSVDKTGTQPVTNCKSLEHFCDPVHLHRY